MKRIVVALSLMAFSMLALGCGSGKTESAAGPADASKQGKFESPRKKTNF